MTERDTSGAPARAHTRAVLHSSETVEWYTPSWIVDAAREVMGGIELDPASCHEANRTVRAARIYTAEQDGMRQPWRARTLWLNCPYGKDGNDSQQGRWNARLIDAHRRGDVEQACSLFNAATSARWFAPAWEFPLCFLDARVHFVPPAGAAPANQPTHSSVVAYLGPHVDRFASIFGAFGHVVLPHQVVTARAKRRLL